MTKKNKVKKPLPPPVLDQDDNNLVDDLLAHLDSQEKESAELLNALTISESDKAPTQVQKQNVKSRFKARQAKKPLPPPVLNQANNLVDDLLAQLDSQEKESAELLNALTISESDKAPTQVQKQNVKSRFKARQARKAALLAQTFSKDDPHQQARLEKEAKDEDDEIRKVCKDLSLEIYEISPDGHCLYSAVGDQLALLGILPQSQSSYPFIRTAAADFIRSHTDDFLPFLPSPESAGDDAGMLTPAQFEDYCSSIKHTATWGGEPEIVALSGAFKIPIHIVQGGKPSIVVHEPGGEPTNNDVLRISYHRKLYGLGEHYNSLRPARGAS